MENFTTASLYGDKYQYTMPFFLENFPDNAKVTSGKGLFQLHYVMMCPNVDETKIQAPAAASLDEDPKDKHSMPQY